MIKIKQIAALACVALSCHAAGAMAQADAQAGAVKPSGAGRTVGAPASTLRFMVLGDWGNGSPQQKDVAGAMARYSEAHRGVEPAYEDAVDFVVLTGDNFYESGVSGVDDPQWEEKFEKVYDPARLPMPFFAVLGNHDWGLNPLAEIQYASSRTTRWQMDGFWYTRQLGQIGEGDKATPLADFFFIDTDLWTLRLGALADKQMAWLEAGLKNSRAKWQFVVAHHPLYSDGEHGRDGDVTMLRDKLSPVFKKWGVDAFLCGHDHDLQHIEVPGHPTSFILSGAGGKLRTRATQNFSPFYAATPGFVAITLSAGAMQAQVIDSKDKVLHEWQRTPAPPQP